MMPKSAATALGLTLALGLVACKDTNDDGDVGLDTDLTVDDTTGDGDGDPGDGDGAPGDGDGSPGDGDGSPGDGDGSPGDGDGSPGDGDGAPGECGVDPGWGPVGIGQPVKHIAAYDHLGEELNICDWAGTPFAMDIAAMWCGPCQAVSAYLATGAGQDPFSGIGPNLRTMIDSGTAAWLTFLVEDVNGGPASVDNAASWDAMYHHDNIPVLNGLDTAMLPSYLQVGCWPTAWVIDPDMNFHGLDDCQTWNQLVAFVNDFGG